jgi:hypothetical protein
MPKSEEKHHSANKRRILDALRSRWRLGITIKTVSEGHSIICELSDPSATMVECAYFNTIRGADRLFVILPTSTIDTTESNVAVRNIKLYD